MFGNCSHMTLIGKVSLASRTDILNHDITDEGSLGDAIIHTIKQGFFLLLICCLLGIYVYTLQHCNKIPSLGKS